MDIGKFFQSKLFRGVLVGIAVLIILLLVLGVGMFVGFKKATFSFRWGENYHWNFAGPRGGFLGDFLGRDFMGKDFVGAHGVFGQIMEIDGRELIVRGRDNVEKLVLVKDDIVIQRFREAMKLNELKVDDYIVVIGEPNDSGQIEAKFIRVMPLPSPSVPMPRPRIR